MQSDKKNEELDDIIQDILDEDEFEPKFPDNGERKKTDGAAKNGSEMFKKSSLKDKIPFGSSKSGNVKKPSGGPRYKGVTRNGGSKTGNGSRISGESRTAVASRRVGSAKAARAEKRAQIMKTAVQITRYVILASVVLFFIAIFFNWFTLSGNGVNYGFIRDEASVAYMDEKIPTEHNQIENLVKYNKAILNFSGKDLYSFSQIIAEDYMTVVGADGEATGSLAAKIHSYYMMSAVLLYVFTGISALILAIFKGHKGISYVRNLAVFNIVIIGVNFLAFKVPYFSMFAIRAKDLLKQSGDFISVAMTREGIAADETFFPYVLTESNGLYAALIFLGVWLVLSIVLNEVANREKELAIENGELNK